MAERYRKLPVVIEAVQYDGTNRDQVAEFMGGPRQVKVEEKKLPDPGRGLHDGIAISTLEGTMTASVGDWIIRGVKGEFYPCKPDIFDATYEPLAGGEIARISDAVQKATENPGHAVSVDDPWKGFPLEGDEFVRAKTVDALERAGYTRESAIAAAEAGDLALLRRQGGSA